MVEMQGDGNQLVEEVVEVTGVASKDDFNRKITTPTITTTEEVVVVKIPRAVINGKKMKTLRAKTRRGAFCSQSGFYNWLIRTVRCPLLNITMNF